MAEPADESLSHQRRAELLERVMRRGRSLLLRRRLALAAGAALVATAAAVPALVLPGGATQSVARRPTPPPPKVTLQRSTPIFAASNRSGSGGNASWAASPAPEPPPPSAEECRSSDARAYQTSYNGVWNYPPARSSDSRCGPLRWDPAPEPNQPMQVSVEVVPQAPRVGEEVVFRVVADDPDAWVGHEYTATGEHEGGMIPFGVGLGCSGCELYSPGYGVWRPPTKVRGHYEFELRDPGFDTPGEYHLKFTLYSGGGYLPLLGYPNPYSDIVTAVVQLRVQ